MNRKSSNVPTPSGIPRKSIMQQTLSQDTFAASSQPIQYGRASSIGRLSSFGRPSLGGKQNDLTISDVSNELVNVIYQFLQLKK
jgi:hypothetical protein